MESALLTLALPLFAFRAFQALRAEQELRAPSIDTDPAVCAELSANGSYLSRMEFMLDHCAAAVGTACSAQQPTLHDVHHDASECARWAASRQCAANPGFMLQECNASCGSLLLQRHAATRRMQRLASRLAVPPAWRRDDDEGNCSTVDAATCLKDAERQMRLCPVSCLGLSAPDNSSAHSCQQWAQRDECFKNAGFMQEDCASTCSEHAYREQTQLRLARNTLGGAKHATDALVAGATLLAAACLDALWRRLRFGRQHGSWRSAQPSVGVPRLPCVLVSSYFFLEALCSLQSRLA